MKKNFIYILVLFFLLPLFVRAFSAELIVDTGTELINALEATINIPSNIKIEKVYIGDSAILFWIESPIYDESAQSISFSGITPGGFQGQKPVLSFSGMFSAEDLPSFTFSEVRALKNDGLGTIIPIALSLQMTEIALDQIPPEPFRPLLSTSPDVFGGRRFLSFTTQDKGTGIEHYEYASAWLFPPRDDDWLVTESPLVLSRAMLFKKIYIRAIDNSGNYRTVSIAGPYHYAGLFLGIIILICILLLVRRFLRLRY